MLKNVFRRTVFLSKRLLSSDEPIISPITNNWNWIPPRKLEDFSNKENDDSMIPILKKVLLSSSEITEVLERQGAENIKVVDLKENLDSISQFIIASGRSSRQLQKMAQPIVYAVKKRGLKQAPAFTGIEGCRDDDWVCIDCYNIVVHLMLPSTRKALDLESHWDSKVSRPYVEFSEDEQKYDDRFLKLLDEFPVPDWYNNGNNEQDTLATVSSAVDRNNSLEKADVKISLKRAGKKKPNYTVL